MEKANKKIIIIALFLSLITAMLIYIYMSSGTKTDAPKTEYATVYIAAKTMPARYKITAADIKQVKIAKELLNESTLSDANEITGKLTVDRIIAGEQIIKERLADEGTVLLSYSLPEGTRAVSMNVNEQISVASLLRPGDFVDVIASFEKEEEDNGQTVKTYPRITRTVLQNVKVLALGQDMTLPVDKLAELPVTVTLAVKKEDVEKFVYASEYAVLRLALRPVGDEAQTSSQGIAREDVTGTKGVYSKPSGSTSNQGSN
jgi:pilus assembly protein CpaB